MSPIPKRSAELNSQIRNETDDDKVEKLREYFKEELNKIWVTLSLLSFGQSGGTQKELFNFIKEERESSRILKRENLTLAGEIIDLRGKVLSQQQQIESLTLANRLLQQDEISDFKNDNDTQPGWHVQRNRNNGGPMSFAIPPPLIIHTPLFNRFSVLSQQPAETEMIEKSHSKDPGINYQTRNCRKHLQMKESRKISLEKNQTPSLKLLFRPILTPWLDLTPGRNGPGPT